MVASACVLGFGTEVFAGSDKITAGSLFTNMDDSERVAFLAGIVEGLATARFYADGKQPEGRACVYDWFYRTEGTRAKIYAAFDRYPDQLPGPIMAVLVRGECGG